MVKKRNRRTRKKYKKRGGASDTELGKCNTRLEDQGEESMIKRRKMCIESNGTADLNQVEEPAPEQVVQPIAQPKQPVELKQTSGVETVIAPLEEEPTKPSIKDRASALEKQFGETGMRKTRKVLKRTVGACRAALDEEGKTYYYNEANETTYNKDDDVCHPKDGIEKTGNKSGLCIGARYKGGEEYWYHPTEEFSTHNKDHPKCHPTDIAKLNIDEDPILPSPVSIVIKKVKPNQKKSKKRKKKRRTRKSHQRDASEKNRRKQMKENQERTKKQKKGGGKRKTKRKKSRKRRR